MGEKEEKKKQKALEAKRKINLKKNPPQKKEVVAKAEEGDKPARQFRNSNRREGGDNRMRKFDGERQPRKYQDGENRPPRRFDGERPPRRFDGERKFGDRPPGRFNREEGGEGDNRVDRPRRGGRGGRGGGGYRGKREFDRKSGNDQTSRRGHDKKDGAGAHNWGEAVPQDIEQQVEQIEKDVEKENEELLLRMLRARPRPR